MKHLLTFLSLLALLAAMVGLLGTWFWDRSAVDASAATPWPGGMGSLDSVFTRFPPLQANQACTKLQSLGAALPKGQATEDFVRREIAHDDRAIGEPPALPEVFGIRELLLRETVVCDNRAGIGAPEADALRALHMNVGRALVGSALAKGRTGDPAAWEDLRAAWKLARGLDGQPLVMMQTAALGIARMVNAVAWKMPLPAPAWLGQLQERDSMPSLLEAYQYQSASYWRDQERLFATKWLARIVEHDRQIAVAVFGESRCDVSTAMNELGTDLRFVWRRGFRYRAEREATANALRIREGKPIQAVSRCSDGGWSFDGTTLRFSRELVTGPPDLPMPLTLRVKP